MKNIWKHLLAIALLGSIFSSGHIENPDTQLRLTQTRLLCEDKGIGISDGIGVIKHGNLAISNSGSHFMVYNLGQSYLLYPVYCTLMAMVKDPIIAYKYSEFATSFINFPSHYICAYILYLISLSLGGNKNSALITALLFGLTSYSFSFAQSTYDHHYEMMFVLLAFHLNLGKGANGRQIFISGLCISFGMLFRTTALFAVPALLILILNLKYRFIFLLGLLPGVLYVMWYNSIRFDSIFESGYGIAWELAGVGAVSSFWSVYRIPESVLGLVLSPGKGLLIFSPTVLIGFWYYPKLLKIAPRLFYAIVLLNIIYLGIYSMNFAWHGSIWSFGPRYILPVLPLLYLPVFLGNYKRWIYFVIGIGFVSQILLMSVNYKRAVLSSYIDGKYYAEEDYINDPANVPYYSHLGQLTKIIPKNHNSYLVNCKPYNFWINEARTGDNQFVLDYSIEKNSINFWWIRVYNLRQTYWGFILVTGLVALVTVILMRKRIKRCH